MTRVTADAEAGIVSDRLGEEGNGALLLLVGKDLAEGDARGVVDSDVGTPSRCRPSFLMLMDQLGEPHQSRTFHLRTRDSYWREVLFKSKCSNRIDSTLGWKRPGKKRLL